MANGDLCTIRRWAGAQFVKRSGLGKLRASTIAPVRRDAAKRVFERLWVVGTLGSFFSAFYLGLPRDVNAVAASRLVTADNLDRLVRYSFFFWLLVYFFTSTIRKESRQTENAAAPKAPAVKDLVFDVVQTASALTAATFLGFIRPTDYAISRDSYVLAVAVALGAVGVICVVSLVVFGCDAGEREFNLMRQSGLKMSLLGLLFVFVTPDRAFALVLTLEVQIGLWAVLFMFIRETLMGTT
jgi:hypothetical protein